MPLESCTVGHNAWKSSQGPEIKGYNPRKWPEVLKMTSFADSSRVVYRGSQGIEILPGPKIVGYNPRKRLEMLEITSFADTSRVVY